LAAYVVWLVLRYRYHLLDEVNLWVHEAGHLVFSPFGETLMVLGGTLLQIATPLAFLFHFRRARDHFAVAVMGVWVAESLMYTAMYMSDAIRQELPLVGGGSHDWHWLLSHWGVVRHAETLGSALRVAASFLAVYCLFRALAAVQALEGAELGARGATEGTDGQADAAWASDSEKVGSSKKPRRRQVLIKPNPGA